jgi:hypothetical protein
MGPTCMRLIKKNRQVLDLNSKINICHSCRETNRCVNVLADIGCESYTNMMIYEQCHIQVSLFWIRISSYNCFMQFSIWTISIKSDGYN